MYELESQVTGKKRIERNLIPVKIRSEIIKLILKIIINTRIKFKAYSYFHLRQILDQKENMIEVDAYLVLLIKKYHRYCDDEYIKILFNMLFDILDSIGGGTIRQINARYHVYLQNYKNIIFQNEQDFHNRFNIKYDSYIQNLVKEVEEGKISQTSFKNLMDPYIQTLKQYYRSNFITKGSYLKSIFYLENINSSFVKRFLDLTPVTLKKIFLNSNLKNVNFFRLTEKMEKINMNNEILKYVFFSILKSKDLNPSIIARRAGISRKTVLHYGEKIGKIDDPKTNLPFLDFNRRFNNKERSSYFRFVKTEKSPTGYILQVPNKKKKYIINEINKIVNLLLEDYEYPYFLKKFLKESDQETSDYTFIIGELIRLSKIHKSFTYSDCFELFYIILEFYDFIAPKTLAAISKDFIRYGSYLKRLAELVFRDPKEYRRRFPSDKHAKREKLDIADNIIRGIIISDSISNIDSFEFQQLIQAYRNEIIKSETRHLIEKGYPPIDSPEFKRKIYNFKRRTLFPRYFLGIDFIEWLDELTELDLQKIIKLTSKSELKKDLLIMCNRINQNNEILKYIIFLILRSSDSLSKIVKKTGKTRKTVVEIGKLLDLNICPVTNTFYLKSYDERFLL